MFCPDDSILFKWDPPIIVKCNYIKSVYSSAKKHLSYKAKKIKHYLHFEEIKNFLYYFVGNNLHVTLLS